MKIRFVTLLATIAIMLAMAATAAYAAATPPGTGTCPSPWMQDADGDGIPNGLDEDYVRPQDGTGNQFQRGAQPASVQSQLQNQWRWSEFFGGRNLRVLAGSFGFGPGTGTGVCDGTGPKGFGGFGKR